MYSFMHSWTVWSKPLSDKPNRLIQRVAYLPRNSLLSSNLLINSKFNIQKIRITSDLIFLTGLKIWMTLNNVSMLWNIAYRLRNKREHTDNWIAPYRYKMIWFICDELIHHLIFYDLVAVGENSIFIYAFASLRPMFRDYFLFIAHVLMLTGHEKWTQWHVTIIEVDSYYCMVRGFGHAFGYIVSPGVDLTQPA